MPLPLPFPKLLLVLNCAVAIIVFLSCHFGAGQSREVTLLNDTLSHRTVVAPKPTAVDSVEQQLTAATCDRSNMPETIEFGTRAKACKTNEWSLQPPIIFGLGSFQGQPKLWQPLHKTGLPLFLAKRSQLLSMTYHVGFVISPALPHPDHLQCPSPEDDRPLRKQNAMGNRANILYPKELQRNPEKRKDEYNTKKTYI